MTAPIPEAALARRIRPADLVQPRPIQVVWEITLRCDLKCVHCGSRAGKARAQELDTAQCLALIDRLHALGCSEVNLIGGEAYLRRDWLQLVEAICARGMVCALQTGAMNLTRARIREAKAAGLRQVGVSIDGLAEAHDQQRGVPGSYARALQALRDLRDEGFLTTVNTQLNRRSVADLPGLMEALIEAGVAAWRFQLTVAMGRAADQPDLLLEPWEIPATLATCGELAIQGQSRGLDVQGGNNIGYFGPHHWLLRGAGEGLEGAALGCGAGRFVMGIEADGTIKGCPSLPTSPYSGGNALETPLEDIWARSEALAVRRRVRREDLWGFCRSCYYADVCQAGCTWTSHVLFGRAGNNPFCEYRALRLATQGLRERLEPLAPAPGVPFDHGVFGLVYEDLEGRRVALGPEDVRDPAGERWEGGLADLQRCYGCHQYVHDAATHCPFCGADVAAARARHREVIQEAQGPLLADLRRLVAALTREET